MSMFHIKHILVLCLLCRSLVSLSPHSGFHKPPLYGDFEAQRHWMELTLHTPTWDWYRTTRTNDLLYWGLDYPPLTAFHSFLCGWIGSTMHEESFALLTSHGAEDPWTRAFMRMTVIVSESLIFTSAAYLLWKLYARKKTPLDGRISVLALLYFLMQPALVYIDHGHFQFNSVALGLVLWALVAWEKGYTLWGAFAFSMSLNFKQMGLYHAGPVFLFLLASAFRADDSSGFFLMKRFKWSWLRVCCRLVAIAMCGLLPFLTWIPVDPRRVLIRLFPFDRGIYEDKVANVWCSTSVVIKWHLWFSRETLVRMCLISTITSHWPIFFAFFRGMRQRITKWAIQDLVVWCFHSSLCFFLFSYQVHEKSILYATFMLNVIVMWPPQHSVVSKLDDFRAVSLFNAASLFSMYPLFVKDANVHAYWSLQVIHAVITYALIRKLRSRNRIVPDRHQWFPMSYYDAVVLGMVSVHAIDVFWRPPAHLPDLVTLLYTSFSCLIFMSFLGRTTLFIYKGRNAHTPCEE
eukprot:TRINITY_DN2663_c0_g1_i1.p1 TRINITY_DN2663_c0_g1~~TRINITY_DN2663_c0_g1_i1.p1  ORF type:complete len:518 (+),score=65.40 TRINITY_DN2663_c0_g1_i1:69-1622(+)